ncbi:MAG: M48 family metallopeptidase [Gammaproteobacteria bacterium]
MSFVQAGFVYRTGASLLAVALLAGCASSPTGRSQVLLYSEDQMSEMGAAAFNEMKKEKPQSKSLVENHYVDCVAQAIVAQAAPDRSWEVNVFEGETPNAFALPGGKIGVHTGMLEIATNQAQLAAVLGHEVGHVLANHSNARASTGTLAKIAGTGLSVAVDTGTAAGQATMAAFGLGAQYGILMPFGRADESEADLLGLEYMAKAGFDPRESVSLWRDMEAAGGGQPPEFMSTHPSHGTRIDDLDANMGPAIRLYEQARAAGKKPRCG